jgi:ATP-dependent protease HslVU (ClpYQ) peptidase subunit
VTCIVGLTENGNVWIGGDSVGAAGHYLQNRVDPKVFRVGELLIGFTSSFRMGQSLMFGWTPPKVAADEDVFAWMCTEFIDSVRHRFSVAGFRRKDNEVESGGTFLVGVRGRLFEVGDDFQVAEHRHHYNAVGCGADIAKGAMYTMSKLRQNEHMHSLTPPDVLDAALTAASEFSSWVAPPFRIMSLETGEDG